MLPNLKFAQLAPDTRIIGIHGNARSGKDTTAQYIRTHLSQHCGRLGYIFAFAEPLRKATADLFSYPEYYNLKNDLKEQLLSDLVPYSPRQLLQFMGTEVIRDHVDPDFWIKKMSRDVSVFLDTMGIKHTAIIIPDVRFDNEAKWVLSNPNARLIHITRPGADGNVGLASHQSEAGISQEYLNHKRTFKIDNNSDLTNLEKQVASFVSMYF